MDRNFGKALVIITGASRGFGRSLAISVAPLLSAGSVMVLAARSGDRLEELQRELNVTGKTNLTVRCAAVDLGCKAGVERVVAETRSSDPEIDRLMLFHNAGDVSRYCRDFTDLDELNSYMSLNVSSALCLTAGVLQAVPGRTGLKRIIVNISSLCAVRPFPTWVQYCRPLDTDMQLEARSNSADDNIRNTCSLLHANGQLLTCEQSISKLLAVLLDDKYTSGDHLDYYDL
ncbi:hypothetical protein DNTS_026227 [Danionella cerebrum]|uniref:Sepiapterin reductase n=1 Tax=Danionella cerebrum TaxID=2873325 RepID=A0A553NLK2_9TELE|nr:hypothetical protein DNTS_026227 [Danionella translucida]